jgi:hypothetical protein
MWTETSSVAAIWRRSAFIGFLLLSCSVGCAWATDPVSPEEDLLALYGSDKVDEGRAGFRKLIDDRLAEVRHDLEEAKSRSSMETAWQLAAISETLTIWESAEILLQLRGGQTPYDVYTAVENRLEDVDFDMERLVAGKSWSEKEEASLEKVRRTLNETFTRTLAFLRYGASVETRRYLLTRAAKWHDTPATLEEFDAKNSDLIKVFRIAIDPLVLSVSAKEDLVQVLALLESMTPKKPTEVTPAIFVLLERAGSTKRLDAAVLLIRALAFNWSEAASNEYKSLFDMLTAAPILQRHYGAAVLPLLVYAGVTTDQEWLQRRIVLVIRGVGTEAEVATLRGVFAFKESANLAARRFGELLDTQDLQIQLANPSREDVEEFLRQLKAGVPPPGGAIPR